jgi:hypothetical protein
MSNKVTTQTKDKKLSNQKRMLKSGELKHVGCLLTREEQLKLEDLQSIIQILIPQQEKMSQSGVLKFLLKTYYKKTKEEMLREIRASLIKEGKYNF